MDPIQLRKGFAIKIMVEPQDIDKELEEEGKAPILKEVDGSEGEPDEGIEAALMDGDEEELMGKRMDKGAAPRSLSDRVKMELLKKKSVTKE